MHNDAGVHAGAAHVNRIVDEKPPPESTGYLDVPRATSRICDARALVQAKRQYAAE
jgi:hypothetical protein